MLVSNDFTMRMNGTILPQIIENKSELNDINFENFIKKVGCYQIFIDISRCFKLTTLSYRHFNLCKNILYLDISYTSCNDIYIICFNCSTLKCINLSGLQLMNSSSSNSSNSNSSNNTSSHSYSRSGFNDNKDHSSNRSKSTNNNNGNNNRNDNYQYLEHLYFLQILSMKSCNIKNINFISNLKMLRSLDLSYTSIDSLCELNKNNFTRLEELILERCLINDILDNNNKTIPLSLTSSSTSFSSPSVSKDSLNKLQQIFQSLPSLITLNICESNLNPFSDKIHSFIQHDCRIEVSTRRYLFLLFLLILILL